MRRISIRLISFGGVAALVATIAVGAALAAPGGHGRSGRSAACRARRPAAPATSAASSGPAACSGSAVSRASRDWAFGFGFGLGPDKLGPPGRGLGGGMVGADVLTPAAAFLNLSVADLAADLKSGKTLAQEAKAKGKSADGLIDAIVAAEKKVLDAEVAAGWLTSDQETAVLATVKSRVTNLVNNGPPVPATRPAGGGGLLGSAATYLGMTVADLQAALRGGKSLAEITSGVSGKTVDGLVAAMLAPLKKGLDDAVTAGKLTQLAGDDDRREPDLASHRPRERQGRRRAGEALRAQVPEDVLRAGSSVRRTA